MRKKRVGILAFFVLSTSNGLLIAQSTTTITENGVSLIDATLNQVASGTFDPSLLTRIKNRAGIMGAQATAAGTRYVYVSDSDLYGKTTDQILSLFAPTVKSTDRVKDLEIVIDFKHPHTLTTKPGQDALIGTAVVSPAGLKTLTVHSVVLGNGLTVFAK